MIDKAFLSSDLFLLTLTVGLYCLGCAVYRRLRVPLLHPVLLTFVAVIVFLSAAGIDYPRYKQATSALDFALGMSVVALGYLLYEQVEQLRGSLLPVGVATLAGCVTGVLSVVYIAMAFGAGREILTSIAPKSVTVPIAVSVSGPLGGIVPITSVVVFCVGIFGSIFGEWILRRCGVRDAEARGFALGAAAHGIGTARAIEIGAVEGALSGLAMALMGLATALLMPLMERYPEVPGFVKFKSRFLMERACNGIDIVEAELYIDEALRLFPEDGYFLKYQGELLWMKGKCADALEVFADAREKTNNGITQLELDKFLNPYGRETVKTCQQLLDVGQKDGAMKLMALWYRLLPENPSVREYYYLARASVAKKRSEVEN